MQRNQRLNCQHLLDHRKSKGIPEKNFYFSFIGYGKTFDWEITTNWKTIQEMGIPDITCLLWILYIGQEATARTRPGMTDWFKIGRGVWQGDVLSPCLFNFYAEYIMQNAITDELQAGVKIARRNNNNLRYADDTTLIARSEEELKSLFMKMKDKNEKAGLKLNIQKSKIWHLVSSLLGK